MPDIPTIIRDVLAASRGSAPEVTLESYLRDDLAVQPDELCLIALEVEDAYGVRFTDETLGTWQRVQDIDEAAVRHKEVERG